MTDTKEIPDEQGLRADNELRQNLPPGVKLLRTLRGHASMINRIAWSADGRILASPSSDKTIRLWDSETGVCLRTLEGHKNIVNCVAFDPKNRILASGSNDTTIKLWDLATGKLLKTLNGHGNGVIAVSFNREGNMLASAAKDNYITIWKAASWKAIYFRKIYHRSRLFNIASNLKEDILAAATSRGTEIYNFDSRLDMLGGSQGASYGLAFDPMGRILAIGGRERTVELRESDNGRLLNTLEGHTRNVTCVAFISDGKIIASKSNDGTIRLWDSENGTCLSIISEPTSDSWRPGFVFHPCLPILATVGSDPGLYRDCVIHILELDQEALLANTCEPSIHYVNAKVLLVGDTGVGKTGLSLVLNNRSFKATDSSSGRRVWTLDSQETVAGNNVKQIREILLWDLAGQPGYRVIHQLHLNEVAVALIVFDARSEIDPLAGVRYWERALRLAHQRQGPLSIPMKKFLVSARNDRGGVSIGEERLRGFLRDFGFDAYFKTSAKEGWQIKELRSAIEEAIQWELLPKVTSPQLFANIKAFLLSAKNMGSLLAPKSFLYDGFAHQNQDYTVGVSDLRDKFDTCIGRLENRNLIRQLTFGDYILLQPELLDAYASAMVNTAKEEPDGLGSLAEEIAFAGKFFIPKEQKVMDLNQEKLLLYATVEELVKHDLALWENANDGRYLIFPSQLNRDYEDAPDPKGKAVAITFTGPVQSLYSTLAVRLSHSGLFFSSGIEMWRNAIIFTAKAGGKCGIFLHEFDDARGRLILFFDEKASLETRFHFEEFIVSHAKRHSLDGTLELVRFFLCYNGHPVPDEYVKLLLSQGKKEFACPCGAVVPLTEPKEQIHFKSKIETMERSADRHRDFDAFVMSAKGETSTKSFVEWAGSDRVTLAIAFTDVVGSTKLGEELRDEDMNNVRRAHFAQSRKLIHKFNGREIKTIGDSFMAAFRSASEALDYAIAFQGYTGHPRIKIRAGIHIGPMQVEEGDVFGGTVNFAARVVGAIKGEEIWLSERAKEDIDRLGAEQHRRLRWEQHDGVIMKGFPGVFTLWSLK